MSYIKSTNLNDKILKMDFSKIVFLAIYPDHAGEMPHGNGIDAQRLMLIK